MKFSVTIPAYKPQYLAEAVSSVVCQTYADWELIIVDDCSPADLRAIVESWLGDSRVRYYRNSENFGAMDVVDNWNRCLEYCTGDYVICIGDDDRLLPDCLANLADLIGNYPGLGVYHIRTEMIDEKGETIRVLEERPQRESSLEMMWHRWHNRWFQYIGDFCYSLPLLKRYGGYFKLPLAWCSDDISAYRAARGDVDFQDGVANTQQPGFQYRQSVLTISSTDYTEVKVRAMVEACDWFMQELDANTTGRYRNECRSYYLHEIRDSVKNDIGRHPRRLGFWLRHRTGCRLSAPDILYQCAKGLVRRALGLI